MVKKILFAASEAMPFAATGGLGDVMGALPPAIAALDENTDVRAVIPLYDKITDEWRSKMKFEKWITVRLAWREQYCGIFSLDYKGVKYYFIDNEYYFKRGGLYGHFDDAERFAFFSRAVLALMKAMDFYPDILHANDWQTALSVIVLKQELGLLPGYSGVKAVYTIHNIDYQGVYGMGILGDVFGLNANISSIVEYNGDINLSKGAIVCADYVTTVSPRYADEIKTEYYSHGLHHIINKYSYKIGGILNGIDESAYNPKNDLDILYNYTYRGLAGKKKDKAALQARFGLDINPDVPIIAMVSRLASHKGFDILCSVADELMGDNIQFVLLGTGEPYLERFFSSLASRYPGRVGVKITYDRKLSKLIYAGADMFLMPSKSEACGLAQMIASRYGTVPIVRETGGLFDTIKPYSWDRSGNGFTFSAYNAHDMLYVIREAEGVYSDKENWDKLAKKIMKIDFSWKMSAQKYAELYEKITPTEN